jgi:hypothetical protein
MSAELRPFAGLGKFRLDWLNVGHITIEALEPLDLLLAELPD